MSSRVVLFDVVQLAVCLYVLWRGGGPERVAAWLMALAAIGTDLLPYSPGHSFHTVEWSELAIDTAMFAGLVVLAAKANRYWPLWMAALQLIAIAIHGVRAADPTIVPMVYNRAGGKIAYLMMLVVVIGTLRHRRRRSDGVAGPDWSPSR